MNNNDLLNPWNSSVEERMKIARRAIKEGKKIALYYATESDTSTFRYRCYNIFQATCHSDKWQAVYFFEKELKYFFSLVPKSSFVVIYRNTKLNKKTIKAIKFIKQSKKPLIYDLDDLVFDMDYFEVVINAIGVTEYRDIWNNIFKEHFNIAKQADVFISTNTFLSNKLSSKFNRPSFVIRNFLNEEQMETSQVISKICKKDKQFFKIGYFSGSPTHANDFNVIAQELAFFLSKHLDAKLYIAGFMEVFPGLMPFIKNGQIEFLKFTDFRDLQRLIYNVDINIVPLLINDFTNCKSELKFFEAAICKVPTIASPTQAFRSSIQNNETGFLCQPGEWYSTLEKIYENPKIYQEIASKAEQYCKREYSGKVVLDEIEEVFNLIEQE